MSHFTPCKHRLFCRVSLQLLFTWPCSFLLTYYYNLLCLKAWLPSKFWQIWIFFFYHTAYSVPTSLSLSYLSSETQFFLSKLQTWSVFPSLLHLLLDISSSSYPLQDLVLVLMVMFLRLSALFCPFLSLGKESVLSGFHVPVFQGISFPSLLSDCLFSSPAVPELGR